MNLKHTTIRVAKTKALISFAVTAKLICVFVFAYAKKPVFSKRGSNGNQPIFLLTEIEPYSTITHLRRLRRRRRRWAASRRE